MNVVRALHRAPNGHAFLLVSDRDCTVVLDIKLFLCAGFIFAFDDEIGIGPGVVDIAFIDQKLLKDVVFAPDDLFFRQGVGEREIAGCLRFRCERVAALLRGDNYRDERGARPALPDD